MKRVFDKNQKPIYLIIFAVAAVVFVALFSVFADSRFNVFPQLIASSFASKERITFPEIDTAELSQEQIALVSILKREYSLNSNGTKYSEGVREPWCADFVSWVYKEAGKPFENPHSGSWRIPGTYTLREYFQSIGRFSSASSGYSAKLGDVLLYDNPSAFGQHTNIVLKNENGTVTTIGGNEPGGIRIITHNLKDDPGFIGYGTLSRDMR